MATRPAIVATNDAGRAVVKFDIDFLVQNNSKTVKGGAEDVWVIDLKSGGLKITAEQQKVKTRETISHP
jgi:hypothetical protein